MNKLPLLLAAALLGAGGQDEMVDNPEYASWARQKPKAWVRWKVETHTGAMRVETDLTWTLQKLTADQAIIEEKTVLNGEKTEHTTSRTLAPKIRKGTMSDGTKVDVINQGEEEITIKGRPIKCKWIEMKFTGRAGSIKSWTTDEVVGGAAKMLIKHDVAGKLTMTMTVTDWKSAD